MTHKSSNLDPILQFCYGHYFQVAAHIRIFSVTVWVSLAEECRVSAFIPFHSIHNLPPRANQVMPHSQPIMLGMRTLPNQSQQALLWHAFRVLVFKADCSRIWFIDAFHTLLALHFKENFLYCKSHWDNFEPNYSKYFHARGSTFTQNKAIFLIQKRKKNW